MIAAAEQLAPEVGIKSMCHALGLPRGTFYRHRKPRPQPAPRAAPEHALSATERQVVLETLNSEPFADLAPAQIYNQLLDAGQYLCSTRSMYRILADNRQVRERRNVLRHPRYSAPELLATGPNQVWSWDITKLLGPIKWTYFHLYVILDIFSRYVVGWLLAEHESAGLAKRLISETCHKQGVQPGQLTLHADRGAAMKAKTTAQLLADLSIVDSHSRPRVSNDNPYSESHFRTLKYRPEFPERFASYHHAHTVCRELFPWYNTEHRHSGISYLTPESVHYGRAAHALQQRQQVLDHAYAMNPDRFIRAAPRAQQLPPAVWINPPKKEEQSLIHTQ
jgi:putative transposase